MRSFRPWPFCKVAPRDRGALVSAARSCGAHRRLRRSKDLGHVKVHLMAFTPFHSSPLYRCFLVRFESLLSRPDLTSRAAERNAGEEEERSHPEPRAAPSSARAWRGWRAPDLPRSEHRGKMVMLGIRPDLVAAPSPERQVVWLKKMLNRSSSFVLAQLAAVLEQMLPMECTLNFL